MTARVRRQLPLALAALAGVFVIKLSVLLTLGHHPLLVPAGELDGAYYFHFARQVAGGDWMLDDPASFVKRLNGLMLTLTGDRPSNIWLP